MPRPLLTNALTPLEWVKLRAHVGDPLPIETVAALVEATIENHAFRDCIHMLKCDTHKAKWRTFSPAYRQAHRAAHPLPKKVSA